MSKGPLEVLCDRLIDADVRLVTSLPDTWVVRLIDTVKEDGRFHHVGVSREESAIAICSGAFLGGRRAAAIMGTSGFVASIYAITKICFSYQIGFPIIMNLRGSVGDNVTHHVGNGLLSQPLLETLSIPFEVLSDVSHLDRVPELVEYSRLVKRPVAICLTKDLWVRT